MITQRFNPEKDLAPMPFDERICLHALEMKNSGLAWRPHVGCFVWDRDELIKPVSPFPGRIYFILNLARFIDIFDTIDSELTDQMRHFFSDYQHITKKFYRLNQQMDRLQAMDKDIHLKLYQHRIDEILKKFEPQAEPGRDADEKT